jgi:phosphoglycerate dehydrogenase-like enzyme
LFPPESLKAQFGDRAWHLWGAPNCFITPHSAGGQVREQHDLVEHFLQNLRRFVGGRELLDRIV